MSIYRYSVKLDNRDPMYGNTKVLKDFGEDKEGALEWADKNGRKLGADSDLVYVEEAEYVNDDNLQKGLSLYRRHIWSAAFHGYSSDVSEKVNLNLEEMLCNVEQDEGWSALGFRYVGPLCEISGYQYEFERLYVIEHEETGQKAVMADGGNTWCSFISSLEKYEKCYGIDFEGLCEEIGRVIEDNLLPMHEELYNGLHLYIELAASINQWDSGFILSMYDDVKEDGCFLSFVQSELNEEQAISNGLKACIEDSIKRLQELWKDKDYALSVLSAQGWKYCFVSEKLKGDRDVVLAAVNNVGEMLRYVENQTMEVCLAAVKQDPNAIYCIKDFRMKNEVQKQIQEEKRSEAIAKKKKSQKSICKHSDKEISR